MARISGLNESEVQKERHAKNWLRAALETFEQKINESHKGRSSEDAALKSNV
jgi:hypothetical protein